MIYKGKNKGNKGKNKGKFNGFGVLKSIKKRLSEHSLFCILHFYTFLTAKEAGLKYLVC